MPMRCGGWGVGEGRLGRLGREGNKGGPLCSLLLWPWHQAAMVDVGPFTRAIVEVRPLCIDTQGVRV